MQNLIQRLRLSILEQLPALIRHRPEFVDQKRAILAYHLLGDEVLPIYRQMLLDNTDTSSWGNWGNKLIIYALAKIATPQALSILLEYDTRPFTAIVGANELVWLIHENFGENITEQLLSSLKSDNPFVRANATLVLRKYKQADIREPLFQLIDDPHPFVQQCAAKTLMVIYQDQRMIPKLTRWITDADLDLRDTALELLERFEEVAIPHLKKLTKEADNNKKWFAEYVLQVIHDRLNAVELRGNPYLSYIPLYRTSFNWQLIEYWRAQDENKEANIPKWISERFAHLKCPKCQTTSENLAILYAETPNYSGLAAHGGWIAICDSCGIQFAFVETMVS